MTNKITPERLRKLNLITALLHAAQGITLLAIAKPYFVPVTANFLTNNDTSKQLEQATHHLFDVNLTWVIAAFLILTALLRLISATRKRAMYDNDIKKATNRPRWAEQAIVGTLVVLTVAAIVGARDIQTLLMLTGLNMLLSFGAYANEIRVQANKRFSRLHFVLAYVAGKTIWVVLGLYVLATKFLSSSPVPWYVYTIYLSLAVLFIAHMMNMYRQSRRKGRWADYAFAERNYIILALLAQAAIAWQLYAGALR